MTEHTLGPSRPSCRLPVATICVIALTALLTGLQFVFPALLSALKEPPPQSQDMSSGDSLRRYLFMLMDGNRSPLTFRRLPPWAYWQKESLVVPAGSFYISCQGLPRK